MTPAHDPGSLGVARDVTAQGEEAEELRRERDLLSAVLDTAGALVIVLDREGRIVRFNRACERATGYSFGDVRGLTVWDLLLVPEEIPSVRAVFEGLWAGHFPSQHENQWLTKDGARRLIAWSNTALLGIGDTVEYVIGTGIDITERKWAEAQRDATLQALREARDGLELQVAERTTALQRINCTLEEAAAERSRALEAMRESESHLRSLMESAERYAIFRLAVDPARPYSLRIVLASPSLKDLLGLLELTDISAWIANIHPDDLERIQKANTHSIETGTLFDQQYRVFRPNPGTWGWVHNRSMPVFDAAGTLTHYNGLMVDITEQKHAEQTLQAIAEFEDAIARVSGSFINLAPERVDEGIRSALELIGTAYHVERAYVFQFSGDRSRMDCTHEWCAPGIEPQIRRLKDLAADRFAWTVGQITRSQVVQVRSDSDLPPEAAAERAEFQALGLESRIVIPMLYQGAPVGFVGFDTTRSRLWTEQSLKLQVIGDILVNALEHKRAQAIQSGQRQFLELLATGGGFSETLQTLVQLIEDQWPGMLGLILLLDEDGKHLHIGASVSLPADYVASIEGLEIGPMVGSCGTACYRRERVIVEDTATDPRWEGLRDLALEYGLRACWSEPVFSPDGRVVGTFAMYYRQPRAPTEAELRAIEMGAHLVGVAVEHERAERALRTSEAHFRTVFASAPLGMASAVGRKPMYINPAWQRMLGYTEQEFLGMSLFDYAEPEDAALDLELYRQLLAGERDSYQIEKRYIRKDGRRMWGRLTVSAARVPDRESPFTIAMIEDITEQRQSQQALQEAHDTLEVRVEERTHELTTLLEVSKNLVSTLGLEALLGSLLDELKSVVGCEGCTVYGLENGELVARAYRGPMSQATAMGLRWRADNPLDSLAIRGRKPVLVSDTHGHTPESEAYRQSMGELQETLFPHIGCWLGVPLIAKGQVIGVLTLHHRHPGHLTPAHASFAMAFANQAAVAIENARLYQAEQNRREEAERRRRVADGLRDILAILNSNRPLGEILDYIVTQASHLLGSDATVICRLDRQTQWLTIQAAHGLSAEFTEHMAFQVGRVSIIGEAVLTRRPTTTSNLAERLAQPGIPAEAREMAARFAATYRTILAVPLLQKEEVYGALALYYQAARRFTEEEVNLAVTFADQAALAIENARLREKAEEAAAMQERGRLARELHDSVTQSLYSVTMYTEAAARMLPPGLDAAAGHLRDARDTAQEALREMRLMIYQLRPPVLEQGGLAVALQVRLDAVERRGGMRADLIVEGQDHLPPAVQAELHQVAQEALNNALKHAHARQVQVHLEFGDAVTRLTIQDDGLGFDPAGAQAGGGLGLPGMRERAQKIGGQLRIESAPGRGTRIRVEVPVGGQE